MRNYAQVTGWLMTKKEFYDKELHFSVFQSLLHKRFLRPEWGMQCIIELNHEVGNRSFALSLNIVISLGLKKNNNVRIIYIFKM